MKRYLLLLFVLASSFALFGCKENDKPQTAKEVIRFAEKKGVENLDWKDFDHLKHENVLFGLKGTKYDLTDGNYLMITGYGESEKPITISVHEHNGGLIKGLKNDWSKNVEKENK